LHGNALAVFTDGRGLGAETQQAIAREMNLSETVFVFPPEAGGNAKIRIYTPYQELPFAGHPVLGTAFALAGPLQSSEVRLETGKGVIRIELEREGARVVFGWMDQPLPSVLPFSRERELLEALGLASSEVPIEEYDNGPHHLIVVARDAAVVSGLRPDFRRLASEFPQTVSVTAGWGSRYVTRAFAPAAGVPEDPATGSAAGPIAVHLARHGRLNFGENLVLSQGTEVGRPSELHAIASGSAERLESVRVGGAAVVIGRGELHL
jgi:trans-2,3-dihydro-3-hydroxyanthranilate isomerase